MDSEIVPYLAEGSRAFVTESVGPFSDESIQYVTVRESYWNELNIFLLSKIQR